MIRRVSLLALVALCALVATASVAGKAGVGSTTFADPVGDGRGGLDISAVTMGDAANGAIGVSFSATGLKGDSLVTFAVDSDRNPTTGQWGDDYLIDFVGTGSSWLYLVSRWSNGAWQPFHAGDATPPGGIGLTAAAEIPRSVLGGSNGFDFYVTARNYGANGVTVGRDDAPDTTRWTFIPAQLSGAQLLRPVISAPLASPPVAGKQWTIAYAVTRSDTGEALTGSLVKGVSGGATIGDRFVSPADATFVHGVLRLTFKLKKTDRGQVIELPLAVSTAYELGWTDTSFTIR